MKLASSLTLVAASFLALAAHAQVSVQDPWVRATVVQQKATGAFMRLESAQNTRLVAASSPLTPTVQVHEMALQGDVMKMRAIPSLDLPVGQTVELKPGGYHLMFMQLKAPLVAGSQIPVTLQFKNAQGQTLEHPVQVPVQALGQTTSGHGHAMPQHGAPAQHKAGGMQH